MITRAEQVQSVFERPDWYLQRWRYNIIIRAETIRDFVAEKNFENILDIGCGDGSISSQLLTPHNRLTLVDVSAKMLNIAKSRVPESLHQNVTTINEDFSKADLQPSSYDLILCLGVLAHVESPSEVMNKITRLLRPNGTIIIEFTDSREILCYFNRIYAAILRAFRPNDYLLSRVSTNEVLQTFSRHGFQSQAEFRYGLALPGLHRVLSQQTIYKVVRHLFGRPPRSRNSWLGSEYIVQLGYTR